jgi:predicted DNA-binding transcriptional regulator YafY
MERTQRIARINALLSRPEGATLAQMMADMEISRATINRDLQLMRDQMNAPIVWDRWREVYRLDTMGEEGPAYMLPGQWLTPAQAYAFLTLNNMVGKIAPALLGPFLNPLRTSLKEMLSRAGFDLYGLDRKIEIDMPAMPAIGDLDFENLADALLHDKPARFVVRTASGLEHELTGTPVKLHISATGWRVDIRHRRSGEAVTVDVAHLQKVIAADERDD